MDEGGIEGTAVLERLAAVGLIDEFADAVDADDFEAAAQLLRRGGIDPVTANQVLRRMREADPD